MTTTIPKPSDIASIKDAVFEELVDRACWIIAKHLCFPTETVGNWIYIGLDVFGSEIHASGSSVIDRAVEEALRRFRDSGWDTQITPRGWHGGWIQISPLSPTTAEATASKAVQ